MIRNVLTENARSARSLGQKDCQRPAYLTYFSGVEKPQPLLHSFTSFTSTNHPKLLFSHLMRFVLVICNELDSSLHSGPVTDL